MPIRINLLAEAQLAEEMRRRDPVKRVLLMGALMVAAVLAWASTLQTRIVFQNSHVANLEEQMKDLELEYGGVTTSQKALTDARQKLQALERLRTNRYLSGNFLNALQQVFVEDVRVVKVKTDFSYKLTAATPTKTNAFKVIEGKPATSTETIKMQIEAVDASSNPGDQVKVYKEAIAALPHIQEMYRDQEREVRLTGLNPPQTDQSGRQYVLFTLECAYPEKVR